MARRKVKRSEDADTAARFAAEAAYAESIFRSTLRDTAASIAALEQALIHKPDYAPAILSMGSVEFQRGQRAAGKRYFFSLLSLPEDSEDLIELIDEAGAFLIGLEAYADALEFFRDAAERFPDVAKFQQGIGCCAGHEGRMDEALAASRRAVDLEPDSATFVSDLGWTLVLAGRYLEAERLFLRAIAMDPTDERAQANLDFCQEKMRKRRGRRRRHQI